MPASRMTTPASPLIVVMAYNRPHSLGRLLRSLDRADIEAGTDLVISLDGGGSQQAEVVALAEGFQWVNGTKQVLRHDRLGLVEHFHRCGDLTDSADSVVLLEDDLIVGPNFHRWAGLALEACADDARVAGISLAAPWFDGYQHLLFEPILDGSDGIYLQIPWFHGMAWTRAMWSRYRSWASTHSQTPNHPQTPIHESFSTLDGDEWFPNAVRYLVDTGGYHLMPRQAHASNTGAAGQHFDRDSDFFQVPLQLGPARPPRITPLDEALAVYDDHLEISPTVVKRLCPELEPYDLTVDLLGVRDLSAVATTHILTVRPVTRTIRSWGTSLRPLPMNLIDDTPGHGLALARCGDVRTGRLADLATGRRLERHATRGRPPGLRPVARGKLGDIAGAWFDARTR